MVAASGSPIYKLNDNQYFNPASNAKLLTTAAAYALLPNGLTFITQVSSSAPVDSKGEIEGDVTIFGVGDANISARTMPFGLKTERTGPPLAALEDMADQIVSHGVHSVSGDIVGDDTWFVYERYGQGWTWDDLQWGYGAPVSALSVNDNEVYLSAMPGPQVGATAVPSWVPATPYYAVENSLTTSAVTDPGKTGVERSPGSMTVRIFGQTPLGQQGLHTALAIEDPAEYAARSLRGMLLARGVQVSGKARAQHRPPVDTSDFLPAQQQPIALHVHHAAERSVAGRGAECARLACVVAPGGRPGGDEQSEPKPARRDHASEPWASSRARTVRCSRAHAWCGSFSSQPASFPLTL